MTPEPARYPSQRGRWRYEVRAATAAPQAAVWPLISEAARWKDWSFMTRTHLLREGSPVPDGVGALRRFAIGPFGSCEEVVECEPLAHLGYVTRKGIPVRSYRGDIVVLASTHTYARIFARELVRYCNRLPASEVV